MPEGILMANQPFQELGNRCRELRKQRGVSQLDVIRNFDFSLSHYQRIERGVIDPRYSTLKKLAEVYGISLSEFLKEL